MTDEHPVSTGQPDDENRATPPLSASASGASAALSNQFSSGQGMVTIGCWIIVGIYLITGLLMNEYWIPWIVLVPAIAVLILGRVDTAALKSVASVATVIKVLAYLIALLGVLDLIENIRFASTSFDEVIDIIGSLAFWVAAILCFLGARSIQD